MARADFRTDAIALARRIRPTDDNDSMCRDCADRDGVCHTGIVCDLVDVLEKALRKAAKRRP